MNYLWHDMKAKYRHASEAEKITDKDNSGNHRNVPATGFVLNQTNDIHAINAALLRQTSMPGKINLQTLVRQGARHVD